MFLGGFMAGIALAVMAMMLLVLFLLPQKYVCKKCGSGKANLVQERTSEKSSVRFDLRYIDCPSCGDKECVGMRKV